MTIERRIFWSLAAISALILIGAYLYPAERPEQQELPWHIEHPRPDSTRIFGLTLGESSPADAEARFRERGEYGLFRSSEGELSAEVFYEQINLAGLRFRVVLTLDAHQGELQAMHDRGLRISATGSGKKISPAPEDASRLRKLPIASLTLIPGIRVADELFMKRFGHPALVIREANSDVLHKLYPQHALDITTGSNKGEKQVLQYVAPKDFERLVAPLLKNGGQIVAP